MGMLRGRDLLRLPKSTFCRHGAYYILATEALPGPSLKSRSHRVGARDAVGLERLERSSFAAVIGAMVRLGGTFLRPRPASALTGCSAICSRRRAASAPTLLLRGRALSNRRECSRAYGWSVCLGAVASLFYGREIPHRCWQYRLPRNSFTWSLGACRRLCPRCLWRRMLRCRCMTTVWPDDAVVRALFAGWSYGMALASAIPGALIAIAGLGLVLHRPEASLRRESCGRDGRHVVFRVRRLECIQLPRQTYTPCHLDPSGFASHQTREFP